MMTLAEAEAFAERVLEFIPARDPLGARRHAYHDRKRIESDLAGLRECWAHRGEHTERHMIYHARRYIDSLLRTGRVYGVEP